MKRNRNDERPPADQPAGDDAQDASARDTADEIVDAIKMAVAEDSDTSVESSLAAEKDRVLRTHAEMENLRSRTAREVTDALRYGPLPMMRDLLPVIDNVDRAIEAAEQSGDAPKLLEGFKLVRQQLLTVLDQHHCHPIAAVGEPFDPQVHDAILQQPSDEQPANHVLQETQRGYQLHDRVVRPSQVIISTGPA